MKFFRHALVLSLAAAAFFLVRALLGRHSPPCLSHSTRLVVQKEEGVQQHFD